MEAISVMSKKVKLLTAGGMFAALIAVFTAYVSVPIAGGYFHQQCDGISHCKKCDPAYRNFADPGL